MASDVTPSVDKDYGSHLRPESQEVLDGIGASTSVSAVGVAAMEMTALGVAGVGMSGQKGSKASKYDKKIGHWRVDDSGQVTYKKKPTSELMAAIQLGIGHSIGKLTPKPMRDLLYEDFHVVETVTFPSNGSHMTPAHRCSDFRFKTFAPVAFRYFRELFKIKPDDFLYSLCNAPLKELSNPGASGSIFYITDDDEFIIKTVQYKEAEFLQKLLPGYYMNLNQNPCTLLPKFYGLYCYQCGGKNIRFVIMNNVLPSCVTLHEKYDLKGSTYKRKASRHEKLKKKPTLKDLDFVESHPHGITLNADTYHALTRTIDRDCRVLQSFKIMDYSLLLGVHKVPRESLSSSQAGFSNIDHRGIELYQRSMSIDSTTMVARPRLAMYSTAMEAIQATTNPQFTGGIPAFDQECGEHLLLYIGIIDILQSYRLAKKLEHTVKSMVHDGDTISVHQPGFYAQRFQNFFSKSVFVKQIPPNVRHSPTKRKSLAGGGTVAAALTGRTKSVTTSDVMDNLQLKTVSEKLKASDRRPDLLPRPTPPPSHSVSLLDVNVQVHTPPPVLETPYRPYMSSSLRSMVSTPSHTDRTDAAMSYTPSSPSLESLGGSESSCHGIGLPVDHSPVEASSAASLPPASASKFTIGNDSSDISVETNQNKDEICDMAHQFSEMTRL